MPLPFAPNPGHARCAHHLLQSLSGKRVRQIPVGAADALHANAEPPTVATKPPSRVALPLDRLLHARQQLPFPASPRPARQASPARDGRANRTLLASIEW